MFIIWYLSTQNFPRVYPAVTRYWYLFSLDTNLIFDYPK